MNSDNSWTEPSQPRKVRSIERQQMTDAFGMAHCHQADVMHLLAYRRHGTYQVLPCRENVRSFR